MNSADWELTPVQARQIVDALATGSPPPQDLIDHLTVGQASIILAFLTDLAAVKSGAYRSIVLLGDPGTGKSHLLGVLRNLALSNAFGVSQFTQDLATACTLNRPDRIYAATLEDLTLPLSFWPRGNSLISVLERWSDLVLSTIVGPIKSLRYLGLACEANLIGVPFLEIPARTRLCLLGVLLARQKSDRDLFSFFVQGLMTCSLENRSLVSEIKAHGVKFYKFFLGYTPSNYDNGFYLSQMRTVVQIMRQVGLAGLTILCDEATGVSDLGAASRRKAYTVISSILENFGQLSSCYYVMAFMPAFAVQLKRDLDEGMECLNSAWRSSWDRATLQIPRLTKDELVELAVRILALCKIAYGVDGPVTITRDAIATRCDNFRGPLRDWVRSWFDNATAI